MSNRPSSFWNLVTDYNLLEQIDKIKMNDRDKAIVIAYSNGESYQSLSERYALSPSRIGAICHKFIMLAFKEKTGKDFGDMSKEFRDRY